MRDADSRQSLTDAYSDEEQEWIEIDENFLEFMKAQVYTQKEIFEIAKDSEALLKMCDKASTHAKNTHDAAKNLERLKEIYSEIDKN